MSDDDIRNPASDAANKFCNETQHVDLGAAEADADTIIRNIRFMAYACGWTDGYEHRKAEQRANRSRVAAALVRRGIDPASRELNGEEMLVLAGQRFASDLEDDK